MSTGCGEVRELYFELRHGNVDGATQRELEAHLVQCEGCQEHVEKLDTMLDEAILWQPEGEAVDRDALFEGILGAIDGEDGEEREGSEEEDGGEEVVVMMPAPRGERRRRVLPWLRITLAAAALVVATMSWPKVIVEFVSGESDTIFKELGAESDMSSAEWAAEAFFPEEEEISLESPGPLGFRVDAERALRDGEFGRAAASYEQLLSILPEGDRTGGSIRLNLARIYQIHLQDEVNAAHHLRAFVVTWPEDPVTPQVLSELCRLDPSDVDLRCRR